MTLALIHTDHKPNGQSWTARELAIPGRDFLLRSQEGGEGPARRQSPWQQRNAGRRDSAKSGPKTRLAERGQRARRWSLPGVRSLEPEERLLSSRSEAKSPSRAVHAAAMAASQQQRRGQSRRRQAKARVVNAPLHTHTPAITPQHVGPADLSASGTHRDGTRQSRLNHQY